MLKNLEPGHNTNAYHFHALDKNGINHQNTPMCIVFLFIKPCVTLLHIRLFGQSIIVEVNGSVVNHKVGLDLVTLDDTAFTPAMDNLVEVKYEGDLLTRHVIRTERRLDRPIVEVS